MADALPLALCIIDARGLILGANRSFASLLETPVARLVGQPWLAVLPPGWAGVVEAALTPGAGDPADLQAGERTIHVSAAEVPGPVPLRVLLFEDQTQRRRLQHQLFQSEKMSAIGQLIAGVAHDLNNPLASVIGFADFLADAPDVPPRLREPVGVIRQEAERAAAIVRNLLDFARKQERRRRPVALHRALEGCLALLRNEFLASRVETVLELDPDLPLIQADPTELQQVFLNLLTNAAQAIAGAGRPGRVTVRARASGDLVLVEVEDDGPGIPADQVEQVFEPFFTTKPAGVGTGLGLSIASGIVRELGGRISARLGAGGGAGFAIELPAADGPAFVTPVATPLDPGPPLRVLVVDDEPHVLHFMRATLEAWGHEVETAADGAAALDLAAGGGFDLVISDLRMPTLGGREFYEALRSRAPAVAERLVFSTGDTVRDDTLAFLEGLARPWLHKPFRLLELRDLLARASRERDG
ncbi:MAG TPA: ATP-binding protein [Gemmatimonadales bacterium]|nr:ATP-binding protein [Gemmatimonadales bacterium]